MHCLRRQCLCWPVGGSEREIGTGIRLTNTCPRHLLGLRLNWTVEKCNKYLIGWEAALPVIASAGGSGLLLLRCHGASFTLSEGEREQG